MAERWTIRTVIEWTAKDFAARSVDSPRLDAELLVAHALGLERVGLYLDLDRPLQPPELGRIRELVKRRREREPVAYILGHREFWRRRFEVGPAVLVPRPETETLIERALELLREAPEPRVLDLCTGSGNVAVTLAAECAGAQVDATDVSGEALEVARRNAEAHGVEGRVVLHQGDLFAPLPAEARFALVTANPPYVADGELEQLAPEITRWEPRQALSAGTEGLTVLRRIAGEVPERLLPGGHVLVEIGAEQGSEVAAAFEQAGLVEVRVLQDLSGRDRVVEGRRAPA